MWRLNHVIYSVVVFSCRSTGAYVQILFQVLLQDMVQFGSIFLVFLVSFSGAFYLALRGEVRSQGTPLESGDGNVSAQNTTSDFFTSLDIYSFETG